MEWVKLGEIASLITKGTTPTTLGFDFVDEGINFIKIESISEEGSFISNKFNHITSECDNKLSRSRLQKNDLLFSIAGAIGRTAIVTDDILPANTNQALALIRIPEGVINYSYLKYVLQSSVVSDQFEKRKQGVAQLNISLKDVANFNIPLPSQAVQQMIVEILGGVEVIISLRKQQLAKLDELVKSRFVEMFGNITETVPLSHYISALSAGKSLAGEEECLNKVLKTGAATYDYFDPTQVKNLPVDYEPQEEHRVNTGDVIISRMNTAELVGAAAYVWAAPECTYLPDRLWRAEMKDSACPIFVWQVLIQSSTKESIRRIASGTSGSMKNISKPGLLSVRVKKVPLELQEQFATFVKQTDKSKSAVQQSIDQLETLKKSLMQKYFG